MHGLTTERAAELVALVATLPDRPGWMVEVHADGRAVIKAWVAWPIGGVLLGGGSDAVAEFEREAREAFNAERDVLLALSDRFTGFSYLDRAPSASMERVAKGTFGNYVEWLLQWKVDDRTTIQVEVPEKLYRVFNWTRAVRQAEADQQAGEF